MDQAKVINPKPQLSLPQALEVLKRLYGLTVTQLSDLPSYYDQNLYVVEKEGGEYILKVINSADSQNTTLLELQTHTMTFLNQRGLPTQTALPNCTGQLMSLEEIDCGFGSQKYCVRLLTYVPGTMIAKISPSPQILYDAGKMAATMDKHLQEMVVPYPNALQRDDLIWSLSNTPLLDQYLHLMDGDPLQEVVKAVIDQYRSHVQPKLSSFRKGIIHGDFSDQNILVLPANNGGHRISGILDFGLLSTNCYVFELAISIMYMMIESPSPLEVGGPVLAGWESVIPLNEAEKEALYLLVLCRFCQSLLLGRFNASLHPENRDYLLTTAQSGTRLLTTLWEQGVEKVESRWSEEANKYSQDQQDGSNGCH